MSRLRLALVFAQRALRGGLGGFRIFFLCLLLGAAAISGVESLSEAFIGGLKDQGQTLLGGDVSLTLAHREASAEELSFLNTRGRVSRVISMRAMAFATHGPGRQLVELRAADSRWPLFGAVGLAPAQRLSDVLYCEEDGICGVAAEQTLLDRLGLKRGDLIRLGNATLRVMAVLTSEPDRLSAGISLGPHLLVSDEALPATGLLTPESLSNYAYRVALKPGVTVEAFAADADHLFPEAGWQIRDRNDAAPGLRRFIEQITMFLTLIGLTALSVGGVGAGQAILAFLDARRAQIAILKSLGASGSFVFLVFFSQVMAVALAATVLGAALGAAAPFLVAWRYGAALPIPPHFGIYPMPLLLALAFGLLSAIVFAVPPLGRARAIRPASLLRDTVAPETVRRPADLAIAGIAAAAIAALALATAPSPVFALEFLAGGGAALLLLRIAAIALKQGLAGLPRPRSPLVRLARANLLRPGAATTGIVTALGLGLTLLTAVTLLSATIARQVQEALPAGAPSFFFVDIQPRDAEGFDRLVRGFAGASDYERTPMIRGRIVSVKGVPAAKVMVASDTKWVLAGDRGLTYAATPPRNSQITDGDWWPADYRGETLISLDRAVAKGIGVRIGDTLRLNVLGREFDGRIANLRKVDFTNGRQNFVLILSPGLIDKAPHSFLATVRMEPRTENALYMAVTDRFPAVSTIRVKDAIAQFDGFLRQLSEGISAASLVTIAAGLLVLAGAIAAGGRARVYDATLLKVLGATRARILAVHAIEFACLGLATGVIALTIGTLIAWGAAHFMLEVPFVFDLQAAFITVAGGAGGVLLFGLAGALAALRGRPARLLRTA